MTRSMRRLSWALVLVVVVGSGCSALIDTSQYAGGSSDGGMDAQREGGKPDADDVPDGSADAALDGHPGEDAGCDCAADAVCTPTGCVDCDGDDDGYFARRPLCSRVAPSDEPRDCDDDDPERFPAVPTCGDGLPQGCPAPFDIGSIAEWGRLPALQLREGAEAVRPGVSAALMDSGSVVPAAIAYATRDPSDVVVHGFDPAEADELVFEVRASERAEPWDFTMVRSVRAKHMGARAVLVGGIGEDPETEQIALYTIDDLGNVNRQAASENLTGYVHPPVDIGSRWTADARPEPLGAWRGSVFDADPATADYHMRALDWDGAVSRGSGEPPPEEGSELFVAEGPLMVSAANSAEGRLSYWLVTRSGYGRVEGKRELDSGIGADAMELVSLNRDEDGFHARLFVHTVHEDGSRLDSVEFECTTGIGCDPNVLPGGPLVDVPVVTAAKWRNGRSLAFMVDEMDDSFGVAMRVFEPGTGEPVAGPVPILTKRELGGPVGQVSALDADRRPVTYEGGVAGTEVLLAAHIEEGAPEGIWSTGIRLCREQ